MNDEQLKASFEVLKASASKPDKFDVRLEERMMEFSSGSRKRGKRMKRLAMVMAMVLVTSTGFIALGGDSVVLNYISPSTEKDEQGNPIPHDRNWSKWLRGLHDHLWEHFHGPSGGN